MITSESRSYVYGQRSHACTSSCERANVSIWLPDCQNLPFASCASFELPLPLRDSCRNIRSISHVSPMRIERPSKAWFHAEMEDASLTHIWRISSTWEGCWYSAIVFLKHTSFILFHSFWKRTFVSAGHLYLRSMPWKVAVINKSDRTQLSQKSKCIYVSFSIRLMYRVSRSMYSIYVSMHPCIYGSMHVCTYGRTDGWMDGYINERFCVRSSRLRHQRDGTIDHVEYWSVKRGPILSHRDFLVPVKPRFTSG